ncbi:MAG: hypothetical protein VKJ06_08090 [Vampirovibrionales bacterium]|nr:hypothetical protein [Vampirovibrionales bacterium]
MVTKALLAEGWIEPAVYNTHDLTRLAPKAYVLLQKRQNFLSPKAECIPLILSSTSVFTIPNRLVGQLPNSIGFLKQALERGALGSLEAAGVIGFLLTGLQITGNWNLRGIQKTEKPMIALARKTASVLNRFAAGKTKA